MNTDKLMELERKWRAEADMLARPNGYFEVQQRLLRTCADELAALRAEQAVGDEQRARELLAEEYEQAEWHHSALAIRLGRIDRAEGIALRAIRRALGTARQSEWVVEYEFEVWQGDDMQAGGTTATLEAAQAEAGHYALMYGQDGEVELKFYERRAIAAAAPGGEGEG